MTAPPRTSTERLPRGPHSLTRSEVRESQRARLLLATAEAVAEKGYVATSVADILRRAKVSRTTFYELFGDKRDCFIAACEAASELVVAAMTASTPSPSAEPASPLERLDALLEGYLRTIAADPALARVFLVEVYAAGDDAVRQRRGMLERFADLVAETHRGQPGLLGTAPDQRFAAEMLVGAVSSMVTNAVGVGEGDRVMQFHEPMMRLAARLLDGPPLT
ncbi:MAG: TetR/AcrR family transcriptional regulator [Actinobacteria bacterium]|nr:TetR/AcrR family transcriptional regulator [Actinomycetota bacterium]